MSNIVYFDREKWTTLSTLVIEWETLRIVNETTVHIPIMPHEITELLRLQAGSTVVDGTFGGGGHSTVFASCVGPTGKVIGLDRDPLAVEKGRERFQDSLTLVCANYADLPEVLEELQIPAVDAILLDIGLSSDQLADESRGFSYLATGPLDLRFNPDVGIPAWKLLELLNEKKLADLIYEFGEERFSRSIARRICEQRKTSPIRTAADLADLLRRCVPRSKNHSIHPATRTFQALRIAVNDELKWLTVALRRLPDCLRPGGRLAVMSFHSLEDRIVKHAFLGDERLTVITKKPVQPSDDEIAINPRSRSAKLRVAEKKSV
ncbi:MAG: 16S rRNA (cytosine(1402)-N(4))-methyltransferase RsmH [Pirellulaceae bacterium]